MTYSHRGSPETLEMYCAIYEKVCKEPLGEITFERNGGKSGGGGQGLCRTRGLY
jgi:hypothetical protein